MSGGDEGRISMLAGHLGLKLVGRAGLSPRALRMLQALLQHRYGQHQLANALVSLATTQQEQQPVKQEPKQEDSREAASDGSAGRGMLQEAGAHQVGLHLHRAELASSCPRQAGHAHGSGNELLFSAAISRLCCRAS